MPKYYVRIPVAGTRAFEDVQADSPEEAIQQCLGKGLQGIDRLRDLDELDVYEKIVEGNVCNLDVYEADAEEQEEEESEDD